MGGVPVGVGARFRSAVSFNSTYAHAELYF